MSLSSGESIVAKYSEIKKEVDDQMYEAQKSTCYEWTLTEKFGYKEDIVVEKEELIMKKRIKNKEILREKT